jgi:hypothetical protein
MILKEQCLINSELLCTYPIVKSKYVNYLLILKSFMTNFLEFKAADLKCIL